MLLRFVTMTNMRKLSLLFLSILIFIGTQKIVSAQSNTGALEFDANVTPTAAKPEPARDFTFYILTKSYEQIVKEINEKNGPPSRGKFIEDLKVSPQLKKWLLAHDVMDLTLPGMDKLLTPHDILNVPEFLLAYQRSNSGGVTSGIPKPKYRDADKTANPARYEKQHQEYLTSLKKFIQEHPETVSGIELERINPARQWAELQNSQKRRVRLMAPTEAQIKFLAAKVDTDLNGHAEIDKLPPGNYWVSSLDLYAAAGDVRLRWDVPVTIEAGRTTRLQLTNLNSVGMNLEGVN
jgi:hypothetical protein